MWLVVPGIEWGIPMILWKVDPYCDIRDFVLQLLTVIWTVWIFKRYLCVIYYISNDSDNVYK